MNITINLSEDQVECISNAFDHKAVTQAEEACCQSFCKIAVELLTNWLSGTARYRSLTEMNIETVQKLFENLLPNEVPSPNRLFNKFNLPAGQAAYITRILLDKDVHTWRKKAQQELQRLIVKHAEDHKGDDKKSAADITVTLDIPNPAYIELKAICNHIASKEPSDFKFPKTESSFGEFRKVSMSVSTLRSLLDYLATQKT